jgi:glycolate oxidase
MNSKYPKVTPQTIEELAAIVGQDGVSTAKHDLEDHAHDEMPVAEPHPPEVVVKPADTQSVARLLKYANDNRIPVTPRGAGTGLSGGCVPLHGGIVLSLERLNRVLEIDADNFAAVAEAGATLSDICKEAERQGLYYPLYPGEMTATIGGNVATNAGGMNAIRYGVTRQNVLGLEAVLPAGEVVQTGGRFVKCSTGYDLTQLIIGSEGTLAVVTGVILKLILKPAKRESLFAPFNDLQDAVDAVPDILRLHKVPTGIEFMERDIIEIVEIYMGKEIPHHRYDAFLMVTAEGDSESEIYDYFREVEAICRRHGAVEAVVPGGQRARKRLLEAREKFYHALKRYAPMEVIDTVVPRSEIARFVKRVKEISAEHGIPVIVYGHAGDGNVHLHPVCRDVDRGEWERRLSPLMSDIYRAAASLGGAVSGEHGIGFSKKAYFMQHADPSIIEAMRGVKRAFDPNDILNPGKLFDT